MRKQLSEFYVEKFKRDHESVTQILRGMQAGESVQMRWAALQIGGGKVTCKPQETCLWLLGQQWEAVRFNTTLKSSTVQKAFLQWWKHFISALPRNQSAESGGFHENLSLH